MTYQGFKGFENDAEQIVSRDCRGLSHFEMSWFNNFY